MRLSFTFRTVFSGKKLICAAASAVFLLAACGPVNSPRPGTDGRENTLYSPFSGKSPKTLDPAASYSSDETAFTYSIYEPPLQYHYLKRPYEAVPLAAEAVPVPEYFDSEGKPLPHNAEPETIAESRYTIRIKKGILFAPHQAFARDSSGRLLYADLPQDKASGIRSPLDLPARGSRELTSEDYLYGIKRLASPRSVSPAFSSLSSYIIGLGELRNAIRQLDQKEMSPAFLDLRKVPFPKGGVTAPDPHTLVIRVKGKYPQFTNWLTMTFFSPVPWEAELFYSNPAFRKNSIGLAWWPVGTGPYMMQTYEENRQHIMVRNPLYRGEPYPCEGETGDREAGLLADCGRPLPFADRIVFTLEKEALPLRAKFLQGYYDSPAVDRSDVGQGFLASAADSAERAREYAEKKIQFPRSYDLSVGYLGFNMADPVIGHGKTPEEEARHRALRQAISIAIDWEEAVSIFHKDQAVPLAGPIPPGLPGSTDFNPAVYRRTADGRVVRRPAEDAEKLLSEAGYPAGRDPKTGKTLILSLDYPSASPDAKPLLDWYQKQFAKIGLGLEIRATDYNRFQDKMNRGAAQIFLWGWLADYPDPENFLVLLYGPNSKARTGGSGENAANYASETFDRMFEKLKYLDAGSEKDALVAEMVALVQQDAPWSFGTAPKSAAAYHEWVKNAKPSAMIRNSLQYLRLDTGLRAERIREWNRPVWWPLFILAAGAAGLLAALIRLLKKKSARTAFSENAGRDRK